MYHSEREYKVTKKLKELELLIYSLDKRLLSDRNLVYVLGYRGRKWNKVTIIMSALIKLRLYTIIL